jgi:hypothetical protein
MSASIQDRPGLNPASFSASLVETPGLPNKLTVGGEATGDYRVESVQLVRAHHQASPHVLVLDVRATLGPVENPHPEIERVLPVRYAEDPALHRYTEVEIVNGRQHFTVKVVAAL